jgi:hypothetical protein
VVSFTLLRLPPMKEPPVPLDRRLGGPQGRSGRYGEVKVLYHTRTRTPTPQSSSHRYTDCATAAHSIKLVRKVKWPEYEADLSSSSSAEVLWSYTPPSSHVFMVWRVIKHRVNFTFTRHIECCDTRSPGQCLTLKCNYILSNLRFPASMEMSR